MASGHDWQNFATPEELARALAKTVAAELQDAHERRGEALLALSGGTTPIRFFQLLSVQKIDWKRVTITLVDERFVPPSHERSNERLVRENLLRNEAKAARFVGLYSNIEAVEDAALAATESLTALPFPIDVAVLGMGSDGHTASVFPDADSLDALLDPASRKMILPVHAESAGEPRLTMTLARLAEAEFTALHIEGNAKRDVLVSALGNTAAEAPPIRAVFEHATSRVQIFWTPGEG